jgi:hypothetical protein
MTRLIKVLGGSGRPAKYVVSPQPERIAAIIRAAAELNQRLLFFKIPYLYGKQNVRDWVAAAAVKKSRWRLPIPATIVPQPRSNVRIRTKIDGGESGATPVPAMLLTPEV